MACAARPTRHCRSANQALVFDIKLLETTPAPRKGEKGYIPMQRAEEQ